MKDENLLFQLLEALNITLVADLAIDHIVHIAEGYKLSTKTTRKEKVEELLHEIGISVLSGAITTLGASSFLFFSKIVFFMQFGLFIFITVGFSMVFALGTFVVLLAIMGPEDDRYSLSVITRKVHGFITKRSQNIFKYISAINNDSMIVENPNVDTTVNGDNGTNLKPVGALVQPKISSNLTLPNIANKKYPTYLVAIKNDDQASKSIDDDNLSSGYESGSVKNLIVSAIINETVNDLSEEEENLNKKPLQYQQTFRPKFTPIPEETKSAITTITNNRDYKSVDVERTSDLPLSLGSKQQEQSSSGTNMKVHGHLVSKTRQSQSAKNV